MITINEIFLIFLILFFSITLAFYCYPKVMLLSLKKNLLDSPNSRKIHKTTASRLGGICFMPIIFITSLIVIAYLNIYGLGYLNIVVPNSFLIEISSLIIIYFIGAYDDIIGIKYNKKFIFQFLIASLIITSGTYINEFLRENYSLHYKNMRWVDLYKTSPIKVQIDSCALLHNISFLITIDSENKYSLSDFILDGQKIDETMENIPYSKKIN